MPVTARIPLHKVGLSWVGASVRHGKLIRGEHLIQSLHLSGGVYWIRGVYLRMDVY